MQAFGRSMLASLLALVGGCATASPGQDGDAAPDGAALADAGDPDAAGGPDAAPPDAAQPPTSITSLAPNTFALTQGSTGNLTVTLDRPALAGGATVMIASDDPSGMVFTVPASVTVPGGSTSTPVPVTAIAAGGPLDVRATFGGSLATAHVRVVPALLAVTPTGTEVLAGSMTAFTVTLAAVTGTSVDVTLTSSAPAVASVPSMVTVPAGAAAATFPVAAVAPGGPVTVTASIGAQSVTAAARVGGLYLSEILYDVGGADDQKEWIELYNAAPVAVDTAGMKIKMATGGATGYLDVLALAGTIGPGGCVVVGGPMAGPTVGNFTPAGFLYFVAGDFSTDLGNVTTGADGVSLVAAGGGVIDNVIYGGANSDLVVDEDGVAPAGADVADAPAGQTLERTSSGLAGPWVIQAAPNPGDCAAIL